MAQSIASEGERILLDRADVFHLLRRLAFAATPQVAGAIQGMPAARAVAWLINAARHADHPLPPDYVRGVWTNSAQRYPETTSQQYRANRAAQRETNQANIERLRQWWLREMIAGPAPVRENLTLFFHGTIGRSTGATDMPQAHYRTNSTLRQSALETVPGLLERLIADPGMMIQIGMDEHWVQDEPFSQRAARLILDHWTVGAGEYADADAMNLSRAQTGWVTVAPPGHTPSRTADPKAFRSARRTGLVPVFEREHFAEGAKTILGTTEAFDARSAIAFLARHPATARRYSRRLLRYLGVDDSDQRLVARLEGTYRRTDGSIEALLLEIVRSEQFWSTESRWALIKSPVHLAVAACRQLEVAEPPLAEISLWASACGQRLFNTPNFGNGAWDGQEAWVTPPERLAVRYELGGVLAGHVPTLGLVPVAARSRTAAASVATSRGVRELSTHDLVARLDPAPGIGMAELERRVAGVAAESRTDEVIRHVLATRQYQVA